MNGVGAGSRWERLAMASGIASGVLQLGVLGYFSATVLSKIPFDAEVVERAQIYVEIAEKIRLGNYLMTLPAPFLLLFLAGLESKLRRAEQGNSTMSMAAFGAGTAMVMLWPISVVLNDVGIEIAQSGGDAATVSALDAIGPYMLALSALPRSVLLVATSLVLLEGGLRPRWLGWIGLILAGLSMLGSGTLVSRSLFGPLALSTLLFYLWLIVLSAALLERRQAVPAPSAQGALT